MIVAYNIEMDIIPLLNDTLKIMEKEAQHDRKKYFELNSKSFEEYLFNILKNQNNNQNLNIELISGQKFPDIIAYIQRNNAYGIEVKTTQEDK